MVKHPKFAFRKRNKTRAVYSMNYFHVLNEINLPCEVDPDYEKDFRWFLICLVDTIIHETLHSILYQFINFEACNGLDSWMCLDFAGLMFEVLHEGTEEIRIEKLKYEISMKEEESIKRITEKVKLGKRLSKRDYDRIAFSSYVRKKYYEVKYGK